MVTRTFTAQEVRALRQETAGLTSTITRGILPVLGLTAALSLFSGGLSDATAGGLALSSAGYQLTASLYGLQDILARLLVPVVEALVPHIANLVDWFVDLDESTDGLSTKIAVFGGALLFLLPHLIRFGQGIYRMGRWAFLAARWVGGLIGKIGNLVNMLPRLGNAGALARLGLRFLGPLGIILTVRDLNEEIERLIKNLTGITINDEAIRNALGYKPPAWLRDLDKVVQDAFNKALTFQLPGLGGGSPSPTSARPSPTAPAVARGDVYHVTINAQSFDNNDLVRQMRTLFEQGALAGVTA